MERSELYMPVLLNICLMTALKFIHCVSIHLLIMCTILSLPLNWILCSCAYVHIDLAVFLVLYLLSTLLCLCPFWPFASCKHFDHHHMLLCVDRCFYCFCLSPWLLKHCMHLCKMNQSTSKCHLCPNVVRWDDILLSFFAFCGFVLTPSCLLKNCLSGIISLYLLSPTFWSTYLVFGSFGTMLVLT